MDWLVVMRVMATVAAIAVAMSVSLVAQEKKIPKDSFRVTVPGCTKGMVFTAGPRTEDQPGRLDVPEGIHLRMNGPKKLMAEIKTREGTMIEIVGLVRKGQYKDGVNIGGGVRVSGGSPGAGGIRPGLCNGPIQIDVEGWRPVAGACPSR